MRTAAAPTAQPGRRARRRCRGEADRGVDPITRALAVVLSAALLCLGVAPRRSRPARGRPCPARPTIRSPARPLRRPRVPRAQRLPLLRIGLRPRHRHVAVGRLRARADGLVAQAHREALLPGHARRSASPTRCGGSASGSRGIARLIHIAAKEGPVRLWVGRKGGARVGRIPAGRTWTVRAKASGFAVRRPRRQASWAATRGAARRSI